MKVFVRQVGDKVELTYPAPGIELTPGEGEMMIEDSQLPKGRSLRAAWRVVGNAVVVDETKAAKILADKELKPDWNGLIDYFDLSPLSKRIESDGKISFQIASAYNYLALVLNGVRRHEDSLKTAFQKVVEALAGSAKWLTTTELAFINQGLAQNRFKWRLNATTTPLNLDRVISVSVLQG
jgi:hypothetical protein